MGMTENKRFMYVEFTKNVLSFDDNGVCRFFNEQDFEDWLNGLNDDNKNLSKLNKILEGFLLDKGYDFKDIINFVQERTEKNDCE